MSYWGRGLYYNKIKAKERVRVGQPGELIVEVIRLGWLVISPGLESEKYDVF